MLESSIAFLFFWQDTTFVSMQGFNQILYSSFPSQSVWKHVCFVDIFVH